MIEGHDKLMTFMMRAHLPMVIGDMSPILEVRLNIEFMDALSADGNILSNHTIAIISCRCCTHH
jgi:hypothetical protein